MPANRLDASSDHSSESNYEDTTSADEQVPDSTNNAGQYIEQPNSSDRANVTTNPLAGDAPSFSHLTSMYNKLRDIAARVGLSKKDIPLPKIVCGGVESSGKSSLLSQMLPLNMPTNSGVCTKVPIELRLQRGDSSTAMFHINASQQKTQAQRAAESVFLSSMTNRYEDATTLLSGDNLKRAISEMQTHILERESTNGTARKFSASTAVITIISQDVPDVTIIDLPGIRLSTDSSDDVDSVNPTLARIYQEYANDRYAIFLYAINVGGGYAHAFYRRLIRNALHRTIGVLTNMDNVRVDGTDLLTNIVSGRNEDLKSIKHWAATMCRNITRVPNSAEQSNWSFEELRKRSITTEQEFFDTPDSVGRVWSNLLANTGCKIGTSELLSLIRTMLHNNMIRCIPKLCNDVKVKRKAQESVMAQYAYLDKSLSDKRSEIIRACTKWCDMVSREMDNKGEMWKTMQSCIKTFSDGLYSDLHDFLVLEMLQPNSVPPACWGIALSDMDVAWILTKKNYREKPDEVDALLKKKGDSTLVLTVSFNGASQIIGKGKLASFHKKGKYFIFPTTLEFWKGTVAMYEEGTQPKAFDNLGYVTLNRDAIGDILAKKSLHGVPEVNERPGSDINWDEMHKAVNEYVIRRWNPRVRSHISTVTEQILGKLEKQTENLSSVSNNLNVKLTLQFKTQLKESAATAKTQMIHALNSLGAYLHFPRETHVLHAFLKRQPVDPIQAAFIADVTGLVQSYDSFVGIVSEGIISPHGMRSRLPWSYGLDEEEDECNFLLSRGSGDREAYNRCKQLVKTYEELEKTISEHLR